jgi:hypothetical protein
MMVDPRGTAFVITESGYLLAELPACWRPRITLAGNRHVQIAKVAIDAAGTAYLFSDEGLPLTSVPAVSLSYVDYKGDAVKIQILDQKPSQTQHSCWMSEGLLINEDQLKPSTTVPSPSTEVDDEFDVSMDWESV